MLLTSRKKRSLNRDSTYHRDTRLLVIATEGRLTEKAYFDQFRERRVQVEILPMGEDNQSSPQHVLERLNGYCGEYQIGEGDELWLMIDVDRWGDKILSAIASEAFQHGYRLAVSNPCFEVWLLCHYQKPPCKADKCQNIKDLLKETILGYDSAKLRLSDFEGKIDMAIKIADALDVNPDHRWPHAVGTHVHKVVKSIRGLA